MISENFNNIQDHKFYHPWELIQNKLAAFEIIADELVIKSCMTFYYLANNYSEFESMAGKHENTEEYKKHFETIYKEIENYREQRK